MATAVETPIPCPYIVGAKFRLQVSPPDGMSYETQATVTHVFTPHMDLPSELVLKVYDRRFALSLRAQHKAKPPTYESEAAYRQYVQSGSAPDGLAAINAERKANYYRGIIHDPPELLEHMLATKVAPFLESECAAYCRMESLQGRCIPRFYGSTRFLDKPDLSMDGDGLYPSMPGVLLEFVPGIGLDRIDPASSNIDALICDALNIVELYSEMGVLNQDVRLGNMIVKPDGTGVIMIDFALSRLRRREETDEEWKRAKWSEDEEGNIGYIAKMEFKWNYVPTWKYRVSADPEDDVA